MKLILWFFVMCSSTIALAQTASVPIDCLQLPPGTDKFAAFIIWALAIVASRGASEGLGVVASKFASNTGAATTTVMFVIRLLGWILGKIGWGQPENELVKKLPIPGKPVVQSEDQKKS